MTSTNRNPTLEASLQQIGGDNGPQRLRLSLAYDRLEDSLNAHVLPRIPYKHEEAEVEERPVWFAGERRYQRVEIPLPAARREYEIGLVLDVWDVEAIQALRKLLDEAEAALAERYPPHAAETETEPVTAPAGPSLDVDAGEVPYDVTGRVVDQERLREALAGGVFTDVSFPVHDPPADTP